jgi:hypothetical protein
VAAATVLNVPLGSFIAGKRTGVASSATAWWMAPGGSVHRQQRQPS